MDDHLTFNDELHSRIRKANNISGIIRRTFTYLDEETFKKLFKALVRPHLEYAATVWKPRLKRDIAKLESVQRRATKYIPTLRNLPYEERLKKLGLPTIRFRHLRGDLIETFKIMTSKYDFHSSSLFYRAENSNTRGHHLKLLKPRTTTATRTNFFAIRTINDWNSLPASIIESPTTITFKNRLDRHWKNHPLLYKFDRDAHETQ